MCVDLICAQRFCVFEADTVLLPHAAAGVCGSYGPRLQQLGSSKYSYKHAVHLEQFDGPPVAAERFEWQPASKPVAGSHYRACVAPEVGVDLPHLVVCARLLCRGAAASESPVWLLPVAVVAGEDLLCVLVPCMEGVRNVTGLCRLLVDDELWLPYSKASAGKIELARCERA